MSARGGTEYDVTNYLNLACSVLCCACCCTPYEVKLQLTDEEAILTTISALSNSKSTKPYGELGDVTLSEECGICVTVSTTLGAMSPGCGCERETCEEIQQQLKSRMRDRGDTAQIREIEKNNQKLEELQRKLDAALSAPSNPPPQLQMLEQKELQILGARLTYVQDQLEAVMGKLGVDAPSKPKELLDTMAAFIARGKAITGVRVLTKSAIENSQDGQKFTINPDTYGKVLRLDEEGDALIQFEGHEQGRWIFKSQFERLLL